MSADMIDYDDRHDCGAAFNHRHGAFECGYPLTDGCFAGEEAEHEAKYYEYQKGEREAWKELLDEQFTFPRKAAPTQAECDIMDAWEFEVHDEEPVKGDPYDADGNPIHVGCGCPEEDIPF